MLFSIIVPIYNVEKYLNKCIDSLVEQNFQDAEIILIDDCSTDRSLEIAKSYESVPNLKVISKKVNSGLSDTRNIGLKEAMGKYVLFLDSDDYVEKDCLSKISKIIKKNKEPSVIYFGYYEEYEGKDHQKNIYGYVSCKNQLYTSEEFAISELKKRNLYAAACFGIYKRELIIKNKLFFKSGVLHEDELWTPQVILNARTIYTSDYIYYHYLRRANSITKKQDKTKNGIDMLNNCKELEQLLLNIKDPILKKYMDNHIAMLYMKGMSEGKLYEKDKRKYVDRFYPLKKACFMEDRMKAILFMVSLKLYYILNNVRSKRKKR